MEGLFLVDGRFKDSAFTASLTERGRTLFYQDYSQRYSSKRGWLYYSQTEFGSPKGELLEIFSTVIAEDRALQEIATGGTKTLPCPTSFRKTNRNR